MSTPKKYHSKQKALPQCETGLYFAPNKFESSLLEVVEQCKLNIVGQIQSKV